MSEEDVSLDDIVSAIRAIKLDSSLGRFMNVYNSQVIFGRPHLLDIDKLMPHVPDATLAICNKVANWLCGDVLDTIEIPAEGGGLKRIYFVQPEAIAALNEIGVRLIVEYRTNMSGQPDLFIDVGNFIMG